ncbi:type II toxin-antitoxin system RelE/ParE family toxin [bacterium]|nr:type II toxin-antitoxin system RelE/ParE family toxin [bacterium]
MENLFTAKYTPEAQLELKALDKQNIKRVLRTIALFEQLGQAGVKSRPLNKEGLFELKCDKVRIYFMYHQNAIIIIGLITLKKTQKAPEQYKLTAMSRINKYTTKRNDKNG